MSNLAKKIQNDSIPHLVPTSKDPMSRDWKIGQSNLSCGLKEIQGWSSGIGINNNDQNFEKNLTLLLYWSANQDKFKGEKWDNVSMDGKTLGPIGVGRYLFQFLAKNFNYMFSSEDKWIDRFEAFVKTHDLGQFSRTDTFINNVYCNNKIQAAVWKWNGNVPKNVEELVK